MTKTQISSTASKQDVSHRIRIYLPFHQMPPCFNTGKAWTV